MTGELTMPRAVWNGTVIADSDDTVVVEGNHYFPPESIRWEHLQESARATVCPWKGRARYLTVVVDGKTNRDAAWQYPNPTPAARSIAGHIAFWRGVRIERSARAKAVGSGVRVGRRRRLPWAGGRS